MTKKLQKTGRLRRGTFVFSTALAGLGTAYVSWTFRDAAHTEQWWSSTLANVAVALLLLVPGEFVLTRIRAGFASIERETNEVRTTAESALESAKKTARSLEDVRERVLDRQRAEYEAELDVYRSIATDLSRDSLIRALRKATGEGVISKDGVRSPVWETPLHYRYVVGETAERLEVRIEKDDGTIISAHVWEPGTAAEGFCQDLVMAVRDAGEDLGVGLNDPTHALEDLSDMLVEVTRLRAQELMGNRQTLREIIERRDGWFFTEKNVIPARQLHYNIQISRLNEMDWEEHLLGKGWFEAPDAIQFARRLYGIKEPLPE